jgi:D-serine deaminase-like pyridoxal phosphate-dependent protein
MKSTSKFLRQLGFTSPGILVNEDQARVNIRTMLAKAKDAGAVFRPHFKTHQSADVGQWFADEGIEAITVSSVEMAEYFASHGWNDITIAFLLNPLQWPHIEVLAKELNHRGGQLALTVDSVAAAAVIAQRPELSLKVWIKIDTGYGRTGVHWQDKITLEGIVKNLGDLYHPAGLLAHSGSSYHAQSAREITTIWDQTRRRLEAVSLDLNLERELLISVGDTPCCRTVEDLSGVQEIRPGNFVFFDLMQWTQGVCETHELAAAAVCPVVGLYPQRGQIAIHGGAVHLSREFLAGPHGKSVFGYLGTMSMNENGAIDQRVLTDLPVISLSQEHGIVEFKGPNRQHLENLEIGDLVLVWPVHSCLTCDLSREYRTTSGNVLNKK